MSQTVMTLQTRLKNLADEFKAISSVIHHYKRVETSAPFGVWCEQFETNSDFADNTKTTQGVSVQLDYYTQEEFDDVIDSLQAYLNENGFPWNLDSVQFEDDTNLIHYSWSFTVYGEAISQGS